MLADLGRCGLATVELQSVGKLGSKIQVPCIKITDTSRKVLEGTDDH